MSLALTATVNRPSFGLSRGIPPATLPYPANNDVSNPREEPPAKRRRVENGASHGQKRGMKDYLSQQITPRIYAMLQELPEADYDRNKIGLKVSGSAHGPRRISVANTTLIDDHCLGYKAGVSNSS